MLKKIKKILLLEDNSDDADIIQEFLKRNNPKLEIRVAMERREFQSLLDEFLPDVVLSDNFLPNFNAEEALALVRKKYEYLPFILVTGTVSEEYAAAMIREGADDYILKESLVRLPAAINTAVQRKKTEREKKMALLQLIDSEEKYRNLVQRVSDAFIALDRNWRYTFMNKQAGILIRRDPKEMLGKNVWEEFPEAVGSATYEAFLEAMQKQIYVTNVDYYPPLDIWQENHIYPSPEGLSVFIRDITEKKKAEEELRKSNERFLYATQATSDLIWELNFDTKEFLVHEGREGFFGRHTLFDWQFGVEGAFVAEQDREKVRHSFYEARKDPGKNRWELEYTMLNDKNETIRVINHAIFIRDVNGKAHRAIGAITDITERKKLEQALMEQQRLEQLKLTAFVLEAREKERNAIGVELHDNVNQILVGTKMMLSMVRDDPSRATEIIPGCIQSIADAIAENRKIAHDLVTPNLNAESLVKQVNRIIDNMLKPAGIKASIRQNSFEENWLGAEQKLAIYRILQEQFTNIVKYSAATEVIIDLNIERDQFRLMIQDNGRGMDPGQKVEGIGLNNIRSRVSVLEGDIRIQTANGKGFQMEITLPIRA